MQAGEASSPLVTRLGDFEEEEEEGEGNCADEARERGIRGFCRNRLTSRRRGTLGVFHRCPSRCIQAPRAFSLSPLTKRFYRLRIPRRQQAARSQLRLCIYEGLFPCVRRGPTLPRFPILGPLTAKRARTQTRAASFSARSRHSARPLL